MSAQYTTKVTATGGRQGEIRSEDGILEMKLALPKAMGGAGGATNPEQLFAGGYAACFENALLYAARGAGQKLPDDAVEVTATVGLGPNGQGGFALSVALDVSVAGLDQAAAEDLVHRAHQVCPYSNAVRGNVDVELSVRTR